MGHFQTSDLGLVLPFIALELAQTFAIAIAAQLAEFLLDRLLLAFQVHALFVIIAVIRSAHILLNDGLDLRLSAAQKHSAQGIIIFGFYRIEFVIMTAGARNC